jgi:hypothetical protein
MHKLSTTALVVACLALGIVRVALGQDRTLNLTQASVTPVLAEITFPADGGCLLDVYAVNNLGISITPSKYAFNGARCTTVRTAVQNAANLDAQVGAGVQP